MSSFKHAYLFAAALALFLCAAPARAQTSAGSELARIRAELIGAAEEAKASTHELLALKEGGLEKAARAHEQLRQLFAEGLVSKREVEESERSLAASRSALEALRAQLGDSERLIAETQAAAEAELLAEESLKARPATSTKLPRLTLSSRTSGVVIRHNGASGWTADSGLAGVQTFFASNFGRALPVSAHGQTATHTRLGFDHRRGVDVALHPDSNEGRALLAYLRSQGITFIAFRAAVPGSATGAHIHIGPPSHRFG